MITDWNETKSEGPYGFYLQDVVGQMSGILRDQSILELPTQTFDIMAIAERFPGVRSFTSRKINWLHHLYIVEWFVGPAAARHN